MGGGASKPGKRMGEGAFNFEIRNCLLQKVVIREKNRQVYGPIAYELEGNSMIRVSGGPPRDGPDQWAVLIGKEEIGIIFTDDLEKEQRYTIRNGAQGYEFIIEERAG